MSNDNGGGHQDPSEQYRTDVAVETSSQPVADPPPEQRVTETVERTETVTEPVSEGDSER